MPEQTLAMILEDTGLDTSALVTKTNIIADNQEIPYYKTPGRKAISTWKRLRELRLKTQSHPVILVETSEEWIENKYPYPEDIRPLQTIEKLASEINVEMWFRDRFGEMIDDPTEISGRWPYIPRSRDYSFTIHQEYKFFKNRYDYVPRKEVKIALLPITQPWKTWSIVPFGGWNDCPCNEYHVAVMKYWYDLYGAEPVGISHDVIEMYVTRPPKVRKQALTLAKEQFSYCPDIVLQGTDTLEILAATLIKSSGWFFWWD